MSRRISLVFTAAVMVGAILLTAGMLSCEVPTRINYQMRITDSMSGEPEPGPHELIFRIFDEEFGGTAVWDETHNVTADETGVVALILGSSDPMNIEFDGSMWLEIEVDGQVLEPRREIVSVPYAFRAMDSDNADSLGGVDSGDYVVEGEVGVVTSDMIADGTGSGLDADMLDGLDGDAFADSGHNHDDRYYVQEELNTAGAINHAGNPVDWTKLKGVPAGFVDGTDDVGGAGDGHSLDAADGDPEDAVYVDADGEVGIGTTNPTADLHIYEDDNSTTMIKIENPNTGANSTQRISFTDENGDVAAIAVYDDDSAYPTRMRLFNNRPGGSISLSVTGGGLYLANDGDVGIGTTIPSERLEVEGNVQADSLNLGTVSLDGAMRIYRSGTADPIVLLEDKYNDGGVIWLRDDDKKPIFKVEPDVSGGGVWMGLWRDSTHVGLTYDGNYLGTQNPALSLTGSAQSAIFNMNSTGNSSVALPSGAISSSEMFDEPGVASDRSLYTPPGMLLGAGYNALDSVSIYAPAAGYVLVLATCQPTFIHGGGSLTHANFGVSDLRTSLPANQDISLRFDVNIGAVTGSNVHELPVSVHGLFEVASAGTYEYFLLAYLFSGTITANDVQLSAVFFPTSYGSVSATLAAGTQPAADEHIGLPASELPAAESRPSAEEIYMARIESEMAAMKAELEALRQELEAGNRRNN